MYPPLHFVKYVRELTIIFECEYPKIQSEDKLKEKLFNMLNDVEFKSCIDFPKHFLLHLFLRMKIHYDTKEKNFLLKTRDGRNKLLKLNYNIKKERDSSIKT